MTALAATAAPAPSRPRGFRRLLRTELTLYGREPLLLFWGLVFPVGLLAVLGIPKAEVHNYDTVNPEARESYLRGRFYWNRRTEESLHKGIDAFQEAQYNDPTRWVVDQILRSIFNGEFRGGDRLVAGQPRLVSTTLLAAAFG